MEIEKSVYCILKRENRCMYGSPLPGDVPTVANISMFHKSSRPGRSEIPTLVRTSSEVVRVIGSIGNSVQSCATQAKALHYVVRTEANHR